MVDNHIQARQQLEQLRQAFAQKLPGRVQELIEVDAKLVKTPDAEKYEVIELLGGLAHRLAGTSGTFGFFKFAEAVSNLEKLCEEFCRKAGKPGHSQLQDIHFSVTEITRLAESLESGSGDVSLIHSNTILSRVPDSKRWRVVLVEDDLEAGEQLATVLPNFSFAVEWYQHPSELSKAFEKGLPDILLMDIMYPDGRDLGVRAVNELRNKGPLQFPVIFISQRDDLDVRLQVAHTGCDSYLPKPLDIPDLIETLKHFVKQSEQLAYKVLVVEDDEDLVDWYRLVLNEAGFEMDWVKEPTMLITTMRQFNPDVILMDIELPGYNGLDLAKVIRQYVEYLQIPIVFITTADNAANRMDAWRSGGDDFLGKPVQPELLIPSLKARAEKSRALVSLSIHQKEKANRERFHVLSSVSPVATVYTDSQGLCLYVNPKFISVTGADAEEAFGIHWSHWVNTSERANVMKIWSEAIEKQAPFESALRFGGKQSEDLVWMIARGSPQIDEEGNTTGYALTFTDISELKHVEESLSEAKKLLETTFASMQDAVFVCSENNSEIQYVNESAESLFGYSLDELKDASLSILFADDEEFQRYFTAMKNRIHNYGVFRTDARMTGQRGLHLLAEHTATPLEYDNKQDSFVLVVRDVTEPRALSEKLAYEASHDSLTGLYNRFEMERRLDSALKHTNDEDIECVLCLLDLDRFKLINDSCGHQAGDLVLKEISYLLTSRVRQDDVLARFGGDEFAILMEHCNLDQAHRVADSILASVSEYRLQWEDKLFTVGVSIGMVCFDRNSNAISDILKDADSACYAAKESGRHRIHVFQRNDEQHLRWHDDAHWGTLIERALEHNHFELFFQPIIETQNWQHSEPDEHFEILLRMRGEQGELFSPTEFLTAAEHFHLTSRIDRWVLRNTFQWLASNEEIRERLNLCSINLSGQSLADDRLLEYVLHNFQSTRIQPEKICFEITETAAVSDIVKARRFIRRLKEEGCQFALDDFGTGVSNFSYLKDLPVDYLKIDGSFVKDMEHDPLDKAMVSAINDIGHVLGKATIAEYVENENILQLLKELGVDYVQGFYLGKPEPVTNIDIT